MTIAAANGARDQHCGGDAEGDGNGADEVERGGGKTHAGDEVRIVQAADKEDIDEINDEGGKDADAARQRHVDEVAPEVAGDKGGGGGSGGAVHRIFEKTKARILAVFAQLVTKRDRFSYFLRQDEQP